MHIGCIADDFTGGSDIASFFAKGGLTTILFNGIPDKTINIKADVVVIALKTRTEETKKAVQTSLHAVRWLKEQGAKQFYIKYCSTFDSTPEGNIGPISDAVMEELNVSYTIINPALPVNGRVVKDGCLYVHGVPLNESPMKNHPLTPMWDCDISKLLEPQSKYPNIKLAIDLNNSKEKINEFIFSQDDIKEAKHFYIIPDFVETEDAKRLTEFFGDLTLLTGGSGLAESLARKYNQSQEPLSYEKSDDPAIILAGSCSEATLNQIDTYEKNGGISYFLNPEKLVSGEDTVELIFDFVKQHHKKTILIYSSDTPENVKNVQENIGENVSVFLENVIATLALKAYESGYKRFIVAGGETSGAVTQALNFENFHIKKSVAPGVPIMIPLQNENVRLVLKSGNFGQPNFFLEALELT